MGKLMKDKSYFSKVYSSDSISCSLSVVRVSLVMKSCSLFGTVEGSEDIFTKEN